MSDQIHHLKITGDVHPTVELDGRPLIATALTLRMDANGPAYPTAVIELPVSVDLDTGVVASITGGIFHQVQP